MSRGFNREQGSHRSRADYISGIDGLRAAAVLSVLVYHIDEHLLPGGFVGVDLFFVISGFVVSMATSGIEAPTFGALFRAFYRRRVIRILPAALFFLLTMQLLAVLFIPTADSLGVADMTAAASAAGLGNIVLWQMAGDYFSPGVVLNPFTHMWSLGVEEQFYLVFPIFAAGIFIWHGNYRARRSSIVALSLLAALSLGLAGLCARADQTFAFYMLPARLWELASGVLLFAAIGELGVIRELKSPELPMIGIASLVGTALLVASFVWVSPAQFPFPGAIPPMIGAVLVIAVVSLAPASLIARVLSLRLLRYFGRISYSLYLWHWGVIVLMRWTTGLDTLPLKLSAVALSLLLADLSYRFIENPARASRWLAEQRDSRVLVTALGAGSLSVLTIAGLIICRSTLSLSVVSRNIDIWRPTAPSRDGNCHTDRSRSRVPDEGTVYRFTPVECVTTAGGRRLFVLGDSHAWGYQRLFGTVARSLGTEATVFMAAGCPVVPGIATAAPATDAQCGAFIQQSLADIEDTARTGDVLFLPGLRTQRYREYWEDAFEERKPPKIYTDSMIQAQVERLRPLLDRGVAVILEEPKPVYNFAPLRCSDWFNRANPHCRVPAISRDEALARRAPVVDVLHRIAAADPRILLWDPFSALCPESMLTCVPYFGRYPLVTDGDHLTAYANDLLTPDFEIRLMNQDQTGPHIGSTGPKTQSRN